MTTHDEDEIIAAAREADGVYADSDTAAAAAAAAAAHSQDGAEHGGPAAAAGKASSTPAQKAEREGEDPAEKRKHEQRIAKLKFLLEKSSIYSRIMGERMEAERQRRADNANKKASASASASGSKSAGKGRRSTRANADAQQGESSQAEQQQQQQQQLDGRSRKKRKTDGAYEISSYLDDGDLQAAAAASASGSTEPKDEAGKKRARDDEVGDATKAAADPAGGEDADTKANPIRAQPALLTGAKMRDYQIDGLEWLVSLYENGLNGILADEMGLGKTIQTISFFAHLREHGVWGPFLVCAPLSTITNWVLEFERFTPTIPVILYYGNGPEREELRRKHSLYSLPTTPKAREAFPIVVSSYEVIMRDRPHLANLDWKYIVVDEGHRLKNMNCKLIRELKTYRSANRLILTGTPLHNNLAELWSLLNFILPDIFDDLATFEKWFDFSDLHEEDGEGNSGNKLLSKEQSGSIITQLHAILKPFLLRRLKVDVESDLPPKKEYLLYAPLTAEQKDLYEAILGKDVRRWLMERKTGLKWEEIHDILENEWEDKRATGYSYEKSGRSLRQIHQDEEEAAAARAAADADADAAKIEVIDSDSDADGGGGEAAHKAAAAAESSTRSSTTAVESPVSEASTRLGTPRASKRDEEANQKEAAAAATATPLSTPRRSTRTKELSSPSKAGERRQQPVETPSPRRASSRLQSGANVTAATPSVPEAPVKHGPGRPRKSESSAATTAPDEVPVKRGRGRPRKSESGAAPTKSASSKSHQRQARQSGHAAEHPIVIDDDEKDENFVMDSPEKKKDDADRPRRYPARRTRTEVNYSQLDFDFGERMWRQIDAAEGGEERGELVDREQSRLDEGMAAWYGTSRRSVGMTSGAGSSKTQKGPSSSLVRQVGSKRAGELFVELEGKRWAIREAQKEIYNLHLENIVMQLRKICCHPFLFDWPIDREAGMKVVDENLINASGKMLMLNRLLDALFARGHKVLIFSQFTTMLDIIEDWATEYKGLRICRIDGSTSQELRRSQMKSFNEETGPDACNLFLLSTRAGGLGINLVAADTVIFYDSDWNPQMDLQAQDRVHRIGQKKPVLIFRLVSANTVEQKILKRAGNKRKLEALVIQQGKFKLPAGITKNALTGRGSTNSGESLAEMAAALLRLDGERVQLVRKGDEIISDANLERLLDRSPAAYQRQRGWIGAVDGGEHVEGDGAKQGSSSHRGAAAKGGATPAAAAFEVTSTEVEGDVNDAVARLMAGEDGTSG